MARSGHSRRHQLNHQWRPKLRHEKYYSSVAGDASEASMTMHNLGSIDESEDAVRAWSDKPAHRR